eukprot:TRINITY_DN5228_c0_g1_i1.p1 TRINITY_DN5228_c0_g1~~TRINITY_DN5228_c0_g1_i1.p1  ORF type:complete len:878 (+),score=229.92 TRINITY_DN5228_c0_g1_i1:101-2635(+)
MIVDEMLFDFDEAFLGFQCIRDDKFNDTEVKLWYNIDDKVSIENHWLALSSPIGIHSKDFSAGSHEINMICVIEGHTINTENGDIISYSFTKLEQPIEIITDVIGGKTVYGNCTNTINGFNDDDDNDDDEGVKIIGGLIDDSNPIIDDNTNSFTKTSLYTANDYDFELRCLKNNSLVSDVLSFSVNVEELSTSAEDVSLLIAGESMVLFTGCPVDDNGLFWFDSNQTKIFESTTIVSNATLFATDFSVGIHNVSVICGKNGFALDLLDLTALSFERLDKPLVNVTSILGGKQVRSNCENGRPIGLISLEDDSTIDLKLEAIQSIFIGGYFHIDSQCAKSGFLNSPSMTMSDFVAYYNDNATIPSEVVIQDVLGGIAVTSVLCDVPEYLSSNTNWNVIQSFDDYPQHLSNESLAVFPSTGNPLLFISQLGRDDSLAIHFSCVFDSLEFPPENQFVSSVEVSRAQPPLFKIQIGFTFLVQPICRFGDTFGGPFSDESIVSLNSTDPINNEWLEFDTVDEANNFTDVCYGIGKGVSTIQPVHIEGYPPKSIDLDTNWLFPSFVVGTIVTEVTCTDTDEDDEVSLEVETMNMIDDMLKVNVLSSAEGSFNLELIFDLGNELFSFDARLRCIDSRQMLLDEIVTFYIHRPPRFAQFMDDNDELKILVNDTFSVGDIAFRDLLITDVEFDANINHHWKTYADFPFEFLRRNSTFTDSSTSQSFVLDMVLEKGNVLNGVTNPSLETIITVTDEWNLSSMLPVTITVRDNISPIIELNLIPEPFLISSEIEIEFVVFDGGIPCNRQRCEVTCHFDGNVICGKDMDCTDYHSLLAPEFQEHQFSIKVCDLNLN